MRHQAQDGAAFAQDAGDCARRAVEVLCGRNLAARAAITKGNTPLPFEPVESVGISGVVAVVMRDRHPNRLARLVAASKNRLAVLDAQMDVSAGEAQRPVR